MIGIPKINAHLISLGNFFHVLAMLSLIIAGGNYAHALEPDQKHHHVTQQPAVDEITTHQHLESYKSTAGISVSDMLHCGGDILALAPEFNYLMHVTSTKPPIETHLTNQFLLPTQEPPPPRILV